MNTSDGGRQAGPAEGPNAVDDGPFPLLALYPNLRQVGWAVFGARTSGKPPVPCLVDSGTAGPGLRTRLERHERISNQLQGLRSVVEMHRPHCVICSWPGGMDWGAEGMRLLQRELDRWAAETGLPMTVYRAPEVRTAIAGKPNASKDALAYSIMFRLGLVGQYRTAPEWEAIAAGHYHLALRG